MECPAVLIMTIKALQRGQEALNMQYQTLCPLTLWLNYCEAGKAYIFEHSEVTGSN